MSLESDIALALGITEEEAGDLINFVKENYPDAEQSVLGFSGANPTDMLPVVLAYGDEWRAANE